MNTNEFFKHLWQDYIQMTPQAETISNALKQRGETIVNDHVAFRTFSNSALCIEVLEPFILELGYTRFEPYHFGAKKLDAFGYIPPTANLPRIFISELRVHELSPSSQSIIAGLTKQIDDSEVDNASVFWRGRFWDIPSFADYQLLAQESEYAAWLSVQGLRANHFTINVNVLNQISEVAEMNQFIENLGFVINTSGGRVKGSPAVLLEQSSTMASTQEISFADGDKHSVPTCYYEFAKRYYDETGELYQGFVATSADKIFESTHSN